MLALANEAPQRIFLFLGGVDVHRLDAYLMGYEKCLSDMGRQDSTYADFTLWLRDVRQAHPGEGWPAYFLERVGGSQVAALDEIFQRIREYFSPRRLDEPRG